MPFPCSRITWSVWQLGGIWKHDKNLYLFFDNHVIECSQQITDDIMWWKGRADLQLYWWFDTGPGLWHFLLKWPEPRRSAHLSGYLLHFAWTLDSSGPVHTFRHIQLIKPSTSPPYPLPLNNKEFNVQQQKSHSECNEDLFSSYRCYHSLTVFHSWKKNKKQTQVTFCSEIFLLFSYSTHHIWIAAVWLLAIMDGKSHYGLWLEPWD